MVPGQRDESTLHAIEEHDELQDLAKANLNADLAAYHAATNDQPASLNSLLSKGISLSRDLIRGAVLSKSTEVLQVLLDHGWDINNPESYCEPPFLSLVVCDESLVRWFLAHGADPNARAGEWDVTPLSVAVTIAPLGIVELLFEHGGSTAHGQLLNFACYRTDSECVPVLQYLVDRGAPINHTLWENRPELSNWANVGASAPLHNAAEAGNIKSVRFLLEHGADRRKRTVRSGKLPVDIAIACQHMEVAKILAEEPHFGSEPEHE